jgi:hypothetical protein
MNVLHLQARIDPSQKKKRSSQLDVSTESENKDGWISIFVG